MCGINGFNFRQLELIEKMNQKIGHRGPDQSGVYFNDNFSLGHTRLSIIDLSEKAKQPLFNEDKSLALVFNGEIYNFKELREGLERKGHSFCSRSDSEVILHLYEERGADCLDLLNGMFALAILDINKNELFLARDRLGIKPLYYYFDGDKFIFSSEIKAILEHSVKKEIDWDGFNHYFRLHYTPQPFTIFKNIRKLAPASFLRFKDKKIEIKRYWRISDFEDISSEEEIVERIQVLMKDSVKRQLISDRPLGIFLSGGVDSTSILGIADELGRKQIKTFSVGFDVEPEKFNFDFEAARKTSRRYRTEHHELRISGRDVFQNIEKVIYHLDEPIANATQIATFLLSGFAKEKVAAVLAGDGGDELFGGYPRYYYSRLISRWQKLPALIRNNFLADFLFDCAGRRFGKDRLKEKFGLPAGPERYCFFMTQKNDVLREVLIPDYFQSGLTEDFFRENYFQSSPTNDFEKVFMLTDMQTWLTDESLTRADKMTMAFGLEQRVPLLDHRLVELSAKINSRLKIKKGGKHIFKKAMKRYLPDYVLSAPKRGWFSPTAKWLRTDLRDFAYETLSKDYCYQTQNYFNFENARKMLDQHINKKRYNLNCLWTLITFQVWAKQYL